MNNEGMKRASQREMLTSAPKMFNERPLPDPVGMGATGILSARSGSACSAKPFSTSWTRPSPDTVTTAS